MDDFGSKAKKGKANEREIGRGNNFGIKESRFCSKEKRGFAQNGRGKQSLCPFCMVKLKCKNQKSKCKMKNQKAKKDEFKKEFNRRVIKFSLQVLKFCEKIKGKKNNLANNRSAH